MVVYVVEYEIDKSKRTFKLDAPNLKQARLSAGRIIWREHSTARYGDYHVTKSGKVKATMKGKILSVKKRPKDRRKK